MVCEEDVLSWFKELESYKRVDVLCGLLNMCLPFELRFAGTYVEELGKRDFQELRGAELRANNPDELAGEVGGAPQDPRAPRRMALYVSLLRSCNAACARTLHEVLLKLERAGLLRAEPLDELLLLYTMALHHPAFTFDQRTHFGDILERLKLEERRHHLQQPQQPPQPPPAQIQPVQQRPCPSCAPSQPPHPPPPNQPYRPPHQQPVPLAYTFVKLGRMQGPPIGTEQPNDMNSAIGVPTPNDPLMAVIHEGAPPPGYAVQQYGVVDYGAPQPPWAEGGLVMHEMIPAEMYNFSSQPSPIISQHASPCDSRPQSPSVRGPIPNTQPPPSMTPGAHTVPRPQDPQVQQTPRDPIRQHRLLSTFEQLSINDPNTRPVEENKRDLCPDVAAHLRKIAKMNGLPRPGKTYYAPSGMRRSSGSDSGSSTGSRSPPETPALAAPPPPGPGRPRQPSSPLYLQQQTSYVHAHYPPRSVFPTAFAFNRPNFTHYTPNGEAPVYSTQYGAPYVSVPLYAQPKPSCWNCGTLGHSGNECKEPSIEEVTRAGGYQLDYSTAPPDINDK